MTRVLVTGSTGYVGRNLMQRLRREPDLHITGFSRSEMSVDFSDGYAKVHAVTGDLLSVDLNALVEETQPDVIFHTVGINPLASLGEQLMLHCEGTRRLLHALVETEQRPKVVTVGSAAEYGLQSEPVDEEAYPRPLGEYGICKLAQTQIALTYARRYDLPVTVGRVFNVYGATGTALVVASLARQIAEAESRNGVLHLNVKNLSSVRDFVHIDDVSEALLALAELGRAGEVYNIASGQPTRIREVLDTLCELADLKEIDIQTVDDETLDFSQADIGKITAATGWRPTVSLREGLARELDHWRRECAVGV